MAEGRGPDNLFVVLGISADFIAVLTFARVPFDNYSIRFGVVLALGIFAILVALATMFKYCWRAFSSSLINEQPDHLRLLASFVVLAVGIVLIVILPRVPHDQKPTVQLGLPRLVTTLTPINTTSTRSNPPGY